MVNLDLAKPPVMTYVVVFTPCLMLCSLDPSPQKIQDLHQRRVTFKLQRLVTICMRLVEPTDAEIDVLQSFYLKAINPNMKDSEVQVAS
jgi:hypothetical protein